MDEHAALDVTAARAVETSERARALWSDADRAWASRVAAEAVGAQASTDAFLARRAGFVLERIGERAKAIPRAARALRWRPSAGWAVVLAAFVLGFALDRLGDSGRINVLAPPVLGLIAWNLAVYVVLAAGFVVRFGDASALGPFKRALVRLGGGAVRARGDAAEAVGMLGSDWAKRAAPLYAARAARILHLAALALALGIVAGLYVRGLAYEYRATWESTFLSAPMVHEIVRIAYAAGSAVTGLAVPDVAGIEAIRAPQGENAARWLHLIAASVAVLVVVPRLLLALYAGAVESHRASHMPVPLDDPYFRRLLRGFRAGPARVRVVPYSYTLGAESAAGLEAIVARSFGGSASLHVAAPIAYGDERASPPDADGTTFVVVSAAATPEPELHGRFLAQHAGGDLVALVDEAPLAAQGADAARLEARRTAWREVCANAKVPVVFADLHRPDLATVEAALDEALGSHGDAA
ncbi:MAG TPA: DUF2868 domain-containing protein [Casimicrobiaceae bacterium]|nr:DUF2868 domain-containing protein [Casimicrobiaceae bacterium]